METAKQVAVAARADVATRGEKLSRAADQGLALGELTVDYVLGQLQDAITAKEEPDIHWVRLGNEIGDRLIKASIRVSEGEYRAQQFDRLGELLEKVQAAKQEKPAGS